MAGCLGPFWVFVWATPGTFLVSVEWKVTSSHSDEGNLLKSTNGQWPSMFIGKVSRLLISLVTGPQQDWNLGGATMQNTFMGFLSNGIITTCSTSSRLFGDLRKTEKLKFCNGLNDFSLFFRFVV